MNDMLLIRSQKSREEFFQRERERLEYLAQQGQFPDTLFIGCSDSRVVAESLTGARPGDLFVVRVVANIVPPYGCGQHGVGAAVEFAVSKLKVRHVVVCGHTDCGGVWALEQAQGLAPGSAMADWLEHAMPATERVAARDLPANEFHDALVEENVRLQMENLMTYPAVKQALSAEVLSVHGWVFDLAKRGMRYWDGDGGRFVEFEGEWG